jgi:carboxypeptidase family protein
VAASVAAVVACPVPARGQALRGDVRAAETQAPLPYSTVVLDPGFSGRFTDDSGLFAFAALASGTYRLVVRAIGYVPFDTVIALTGRPIVLHVGLLPLAFELPPVTVVGMRTCLRPGPPAPDSEPELAAIFDELRETAARYRLLSDAYPFKYWIERRMWDDPPPPRGEALVIDTVELRSDVRRRYAPGGLLEVQAGPRGRLERMLRVPTLVDLADSIFHKAHCFAYAGTDTLDGRSQWRVDFLAAEQLRAPDVAGSAWLDTETYLLHRLTFRLTRPERALATVRSLEVTVAFGDLLPSVTVPTRIAATSEAARGPRRRLTGHEEQRLLRVEFVRAPPGSQPP